MKIMKTFSAINLWQARSAAPNTCISDAVVEIESILALEHCVKCASCVFEN